MAITSSGLPFQVILVSVLATTAQSYNPNIAVTILV